MKHLKMIIAVVLVVCLSAGLAITGTLAYLTDRDSEANVFTVGNVSIDLNEEFEQGATLIPGVEIEKKPTITNTGENDAWVWLEFAIPSALDNAVQGTEQGSNENVIHWNPKGATTEGYVTPERVQAAIDGGFFGDMDTNSLTAAYINENKMHWNVFDSIADGKNMYTTEIEVDGEKVPYNVYVLLYNKALTPGETTLPNIEKVFLDAQVDIDPNGDWYRVVNGEATKIDWNSTTNGNPIIYVSAYAIQKDEFDNVRDAYAAYQAQWGDNGSEYADPNTADTWDGTADPSWYNDTDTEFVITTAEQLAGFAKLVDGGNTFEGKTVKLDANIDLYFMGEDGEAVCFEPIGSYRKDTAFKGTFDGQGYTISNMSQNTWALDNGYYYEDLGLGLFGKVEDATVKNLTMDNASISGESGMCGTVAAAAYGECTFENITVTNSNVADYQYYAGGIVGWASGDHQYINCNVDASTTIATQWDDFDNSTGGIIGGCGSNATIYLKDCDVACRIDAYNDVTSSYQWYAYRRCGMLIGNPGLTIDVDGTTYAAAPQLTCENVTVTYGDWANYTYCAFAGTNWPYVRVQEGISNSAYSNPRYGHPTDANGNEVVDDNHVHNEGEDHLILCKFDQLYGGGQGVYGGATHDGVTVIYNNK